MTNFPPPEFDQPMAPSGRTELDAEVSRDSVRGIKPAGRPSRRSPTLDEQARGIGRGETSSGRTGR